MDKQWVIDKEYKDVVFESIKAVTALVKKWTVFEKDVTTNPFYHPKAKRIVKLKGKTTFPDGTYRYKNEPLRVVYYPEKGTNIIYPLEAASSTEISYKKRTKGK
jgi:mRNA-degrading endonuclease RelE of RelBE toxin-antitoxin system